MLETKLITVKGCAVAVPEWVRYVAMDRGGEWFGYSHMPTLCIETIEIDDESFREGFLWVARSAEVQNEYLDELITPEDVNWKTSLTAV